MKKNKFYPKTIALGITVGILSGYLGISGAVFLLPALTHLYSYSRHTATKISTAVIAPTAISATISYWQQQNLHLTMGIFLAATMLVGAQIGRKILNKTSTKTLQISALTFYVFLLAQLFTQTFFDTKIVTSQHLTIPLLLVVGITTGIIATTLGIGGGIILVPTLSFVLDFTPATARGTALLAIIPAATITTTQNFQQKQIPPQIVPILAISAISCTWVGVKLANNTPEHVNTAIFASLIITIFIKTLFDVKNNKQ